MESTHFGVGSGLIPDLHGLPKHDADPEERATAARGHAFAWGPLPQQVERPSPVRVHVCARQTKTGRWSPVAPTTRMLPTKIGRASGRERGNSTEESEA